MDVLDHSWRSGISWLPGLGMDTSCIMKVPGGEEILFMNIDGTQSTTNFTNFFFTITGFHGFHVFSGVIINIIMLIMTWRGDFERKGHYLMIEKAGLVLAFCGPGMGICIHLFLSVII